MRREGVVSSQSFGSSIVSLACITPMCSVQRFPGSHSPRLALGSLGSHGWRVRVCQPWGRNSVQGLAVPKVEVPGHPEHPPPLKAMQLLLGGQRILYNFYIFNKQYFLTQTDNLPLPSFSRTVIQISIWALGNFSCKQNKIKHNRRFYYFQW